MDLPLDQIVKRVARLCGLVSKPELNGACVTIDSYDPTRDRFGVTTLRKPTTKGDATVSILVKRSNVKLTVNPAEIHSPVQTGPNPPCLQAAGRFLGQPTQQHRPENLCPTSIARQEVLIISPDDEDDLLIFEDYDFIGERGGVGLICNAGNAIIFRRCRFQGDHYGVLVGCLDAKVMNKPKEVIDPELYGSPKVLFESCLFENCTRTNNASTGAVVGSKGTATFLNCVFRNCDSGVEVKEGGKADLIHCTISDVRRCGVEVPRYGICSMLHCLIEKVVSIGAAAMHGSNFVIMKSRVEGKMGCYSCGMIFTGKKAATVTVNDCIVTDCVFGIKAESYNVNVKVTNTTMINCTGFGLIVGDSALGTVTVNNCKFHNCTLGNASGEQCVVTVDGARQTPNTEAASLCNCGRCMECHLVKRAAKEAGLGTVNCAKCAAEEPMDTKFKSCSKCKNVCYCSRECQTAHWKEHKSICDPRYKYSKLKFDA